MWSAVAMYKKGRGRHLGSATRDVQKRSPSEKGQQESKFGQDYASASRSAAAPDATAASSRSLANLLTARKMARASSSGTPILT